MRLGHRLEDPAETPPGERPDLLVIGTAAGEGDPSAVASVWTGRVAIGPRAVVLIETLRAVDRLRAIASGVDAVIAVERMAGGSAAIRPHARPGRRAAVHACCSSSTTPSARPPSARSLEEANIRVVRCALAQAVQELLDREVPDLMLLATRLPDGDGATVARIVREDPRFRMMPIVFTGPDEVPERVAALQAGADDYLADPAGSRAAAPDRGRARRARAPAPRAAPPRPAHRPAQPGHAAGRAGVRGRLRPPPRRPALACWSSTWTGSTR